MKYNPYNERGLNAKLFINILAFADDICLFHQNNNELLKSLSILNNFAQISDLKINEKKSIIFINNKGINNIKQFANTNQLKLSILDIKENPIYLGIPLLKINWYNKINQLKTRLRKTMFLDLNLYQRVVAVNTYIYSTIYYFDQHDQFRILF